MNTRSFWLSALISGAAIGVIAHLPVLNFINCFLCLWVWLGGILAVFLYKRFQHDGPGLTPGQGAGLGAVSGVIGALIGVVVNALTGVISFPLFMSLARFAQVEGDLPFQTVNFGSIMASTFIFLCLDIITYPLFGALSGLLTASIKKEPQL